MALVVLASLLAVPATAHPERPAEFPAGALGTPSYRFEGPSLVVCKPDTEARLQVLPEALRTRNQALLDQCEFEHINAAIDEVRANGEQGTRILVMPGVYREEPYVGAVDPACLEITPPAEEDTMDIGGIPLPPGHLTAQQEDPSQDEGNNDPGALVLSYEQQTQCPYLQNLIPILGDSDFDGVCDNSLCNLQIEGTGANPLDTVIDGDYSQLNGIRADRADGLYLRNLTVQRFEFNAVYIIESDGFVFDETITRWNDEYGFLSFAVDHGLYQNCEGYGNGDSAIYPGSATDLNAEAGYFDDNEGLRFGTEVRGCRGHHNALGYSGTAGNSVHTHHNEFDHNAVGTAMDSLFPDHPGLPQDHAYFHDNVYHSNNTGYFERDLWQGKCEGPFSERDYDEGIVCPVIPLPVGTGLLLAGGNYNLYENNFYYDNWRQGTFQFFVPATLRGEDSPTEQFDTSNHNTWRGSTYGVNVNGLTQPNGVDMVWDGEGEANCWTDNTGPEGGSASTAIGDGSGTNQVPGAPFPGCDPRPPFTPGPAIAAAATCADYSRTSNPNPDLCNWFTTPEPPEDRMPEGPTIDRLAGADRIATSVLTSVEAFPGQSANVVLATSENFADALAGAPLAAHLEAPLLITATAGLDDRIAEEITRLGAQRVWLLGGTAALSEQVVEDLEALGIREITRVAGDNRFGTAVKIAGMMGSGNAFLVEGADFASALAASAAGALVGRPVLLTSGDALSPETSTFLEGGLMVDIRLVGDAVSQAVMDSLPDVNASISDIERTAGADALETSKLMADLGVQMGQDDTELWIATVDNWPDALSAAAAAAVDEGVLLQVSADTLGDGSPAATYLAEKAPVLENIRIAGGTAAVSQAVEDAIAAATGGTSGDARGDRSHGTFVSTGAVAPLADAPAEYADVTGTATMVRTIHGTTEVEVLVEGMPADTFAPVHVHVGSCAEAGGDHFQFVPGGEMMPPNEIHPRFVTDEVGVGRGTMTAFAIAGNDARSLVIHDPDGNKVACAEFGGQSIPDGAETMPTLASFMAPDTTFAEQSATTSWLWWAIAVWAVLSFLLGWIPRRARARARRQA